MKQDSIPIIMLSGMAADESLFASQIASFPNLRVQPWIEPKSRETLPQYAARLANVADPGCPCIVGGASFGGMVAREMALHLRAEACILIGSIRSPVELPWSIRRFRIIARFGPGSLRRLSQILCSLDRGWLPRTARRQVERLVGNSSYFERWAICALLNWKASPDLDQTPTFQIHGSEDDVLPVSLTRPDVIVPGGEHALPLFRSREVNDFISRTVQMIAACHHEVGHVG